MRAALLRNRRAGTPISEAALVSALEIAGWTVSYRVDIEKYEPTRKLERELARHADVVLVVGGDGTVGRMAKRLAGTNMPMAIIPAGSANNIARSLGIGAEPLEAAARLVRTVERRVDLGVAHAEPAPDERVHFLEGVSTGVLAHVLGEKASHEHKEPPKASRLIADELRRYAPRRFDIEADGHDLSGEYLLVAVMNIRSLGPSIQLAPSALCDDGEFDLVRVGPELRGALIDALEDVENDEDVVLPSLDAVRVTRVRIRSREPWAHHDDEPWQPRGAITIGVEPGAVRMLLPAP